MLGNRLRWGALAWLLTLQFFVVEAIAQWRYSGDYSRGRDLISDLGALGSSTHRLMNASFAAQGVLILGGVLLVLPTVRRTSARWAQALLAAAAVGVLLVGVFPEDGKQHAVHATGAVLYFVGGALGLIALAYALRPRSELLGTILAVLGLAGVVGTVFYLDAITEYLGEGGTERVAAYVVPVGLAVTGVALVRLSSPDGTLPEIPAAGSARQQERLRARAERAERARERDVALEAAAARRNPGAPAESGAPGSGDLGDHGPDDRETDGPGADAREVAARESQPVDDDLEDEIDPEDPWATPSRRRR